MNALNPEHTSAVDRLVEQGGVLTTGLLRLQTRKSSKLFSEIEQRPLAISGQQSGRGMATASRDGVP
jgi:hypothetical protein